MDPRPHEFVILIAGADRSLLELRRDATIGMLERTFENATFTFHIADEVADGGRFLVVPCRGSVGGGEAMRAPPPAGLRDDIERFLEETGFLTPPVLQ